jgi:hypothetical protein
MGSVNEAHDFQGAATFYDPDGIKYESQWIYTFYPYRSNKQNSAPTTKRQEMNERKSVPT